MRAGFTKPQPANLDLAYAKFAPNQMVQRYAASDDVAARIARPDLDAVVAFQRLNRFRFNEREFVIRLRFRKCALL